MALYTVDIVLFTISILASASIGVYYGWKGIKSTPLEYLLGGRSMKPLPLALSMMVGTVSAITIMGNAGEMYVYGTQLWLMDFGISAGLIIVAKVFIPIMYPLNMVSLYQYMEQRFGSVWLRRATVLLQLLGGYFFIGFLLIPPSIALFYVTDKSLPTYASIIIVGATCTLYSSFGGVKAVVYADVFQSMVMLVGVLAIVIQGARKVGGLDLVWDISYHNNRIEFFNMSLDPYQRHSFWLCLIYGIFFALGTFGVNQSQTQRYFSTGSLTQAKRVLYYAAIGLLFMRGFINLMGLVIYAVFKDCDPLSVLGQVEPGTVVVSYVIQILPEIPGLAGLFMAAVYAAVLSSVSTQLNSMTALLWEDFLKVLPVFKAWSEVKIGALQKVIVFLTGVLCIILGLVVAQFKNFLIALLTINGALAGPLIGLFLTAIYLPWVNVKGAFSGFIVSLIINVWIALGQLFRPKPEFLPLSRDGCPVTATTTPDFNTTITNSVLDLTNTTMVPETTSPPPEDPMERLYGLSYCLNSVWGTLFCILVALIVTAATGSNSPEDVDQKLIYPRSWKLFQRSLVEQIKEFVNKKILRRPTSTTGVENDKPTEETEVKEPLNNTTEHTDIDNPNKVIVVE